MTYPEKKRRFIICLSAAIAVVLVLALVILILALTVFKPKHPEITVNSIAVSDLDFSIDIAKFRVHLNLSLNTGVSVQNPNLVGFRNSNSTAILRFKGTDVGDAPIPAGLIGAQSTTNLTLTLSVRTDRLIFDPDFYKEVFAGTLHFQTFIAMKGKVWVLFNINVVSYTTCGLDIHLASRMVLNQTCQYKIKI